MDFEEFRERLMEDLKDSLQDRTGKEYTADANHVKKLQNADYDGIVIRPEGEQVGVNLDAQMLYHYDSKEKVFELAEKFDARKKERTSEKGDKEKGSVLKDLDSKKKEISDKPKDKAPKTHKKEDMSL